MHFHDSNRPMKKILPSLRVYSVRKLQNKIAWYLSYKMIIINKFEC